MNKNKFMNLAMLEAQKAYENNEVPVGAVIIKNNEVIGYGYNQKESTNNISAHAEINALVDAAKKLNTWKLDDCEIYVTMEPCMMCYTAIKESRIKKIYCSTSQDMSKKKSFRYYVKEDEIEIQTGLLKEESEKLIKKFFQKLRG